ELRVDRIMWAGDFPHHEGVWPWTTKALRANFAGVPEDEVRRMLSLNAADCYGFDLEQLRLIADRVGPTVAEVAEPLAPSDYPSYPDETICLTFNPTLRMNSTI